MAWRLLDAFTCRRHGLIGAALLRCSVSVIMLVGYIWEIPVQAAVLGNSGQLSYSEYIRFVQPNYVALYRYAHSAASTDALLVASIIISAAYAIGFAPRVLSWLFFITAFANVSRGGFDSDGGRTLLLLVAFLLCFTDSSQFLTLFPRRRWRRPHWLRMQATMLHNAAYFLIRWQICCVYLWAAFYKLGGAQWRDGTAMAYVLQAEHFLWAPTLSHPIATNALLVALMTYGTLVFQGAFPFLMWSDRLKPFMVAIACLLHVSIAVLMGLVSFSATMIACDLSLLSDGQFRRLISFCRQVVSTIRRAGESHQLLLSTEFTHD
jgi:hypothetical protein